MKYSEIMNNLFHIYIFKDFYIHKAISNLEQNT